MSDTQLLLLSITQAAKLLGVGRTMMYAMVHDGRLGPQPIRFGSKTLLRADELRQWVQAGCPPRREWQRRADFASPTGAIP